MSRGVIIQVMIENTSIKVLFIMCMKHILFNIYKDSIFDYQIKLKIGSIFFYSSIYIYTSIYLALSKFQVLH